MSASNRGPNPASAQDPKSVAALVSGIFAVLLSIFCGLLSIPIGILAIVMGVQGRKTSLEMGKGAGLAVAGIALGILAIVLTLAFFAAAMIFGTPTT